MTPTATLGFYDSDNGFTCAFELITSMSDHRIAPRAELLTERWNESSKEWLDSPRFSEDCNSVFWRKLAQTPVDSSTDTKQRIPSYIIASMVLRAVTRDASCW